MFHDGDLQSGIALALEKKTAVVCFVRDDDPISNQWQNEFLGSQNLRSILAEQATLLSIDATSQERAFLSAFCPINQLPAVVVIRDGTLKDQIVGTFSEQEFTDRLKLAINSQAPHQSQLQSPLRQTGAFPDSVDTPTEEPQSPHSSDANTPPRIVQNLLEERRKRLEAEKKAKDDADKEERAARRRAQRDAAELGSSSSPRKASEVSYAQEQVKKKREAKQERERILRIIENDRIERRERETRRKALARAEAEGQQNPEGVDIQILSTHPAPNSSATACAIQVRLLDGSSMRSSFDAKGTILSDIRKWIDEYRTDGNQAYELKQILSPLPNRTLTESEEIENLQSLGCAPSATLVLVPVPGAVSAYTEGASNFLSKFHALLAGFFAAIFNTIKFFLGIGTTAAPSSASTSANSSSNIGAQSTPAPTTDKSTSRDASSSESGIRIRTLKNQRDEKKDPPQLYNGNQSNVEPNVKKDESNEDEKLK